MSGGSRENPPDVRGGWESLSDVREWLGGYPECPRVVGKPSRLSGVVGRLSRMSGSGQEALPCVQEWSGGPP